MELKSELVELRHSLHRRPELASEESATAGQIAGFLRRFAPDRVVAGLGGHGLAALYRGAAPGPRVLVRAELDALLIPETITPVHGSSTAGVSHKCGHDGHMAMLAGLASQLHRRRPDRGEVVLLFQPAEETGEGARRVLDDPAFAELRPDRVFALHNLPGFPLGQVVVRAGVFASASVGLAIRLTGDSSHAAEPHRGRSPALALAELVCGLSAVPQLTAALHEAAQVTVIHARLGEVAFGTSPGEAVVMATLRSHDPELMSRLRDRSVALAQGTARTHELKHAVEWVEPFPATINEPAAVDLVRQAARQLGLDVREVPLPFPWSEDFGHFTDAFPGALFGLGAGEAHPALHGRHYDFPDELLMTGCRLLASVVEQSLGPDHDDR